jgi:hypothetical protein
LRALDLTRAETLKWLLLSNKKKGWSSEKRGGKGKEEEKRSEGIKDKNMIMNPIMLSESKLSVHQIILRDDTLL